MALANCTESFDVGLEAMTTGDYVYATQSWEQLAERGNLDAQYNLAGIYRVGEGVPKDLAKAIALYRLAAKQGDIWAQYNLADMYRLGQGAPRSLSLAYMWFDIANRSGHLGAGDAKSVLERDLTQEQISQAQAQAEFCINRALQECE